MKETPALKLARRLAELFANLPEVEAVALAGSLTGGLIDQASDIDLYVYTTSEIPLQARMAIVEKTGATQADMDLRFWDLGDEWYDAEIGLEVDIIYWDTGWITGQIDRALVEYQANVGYSTCFWYTVRNSQILADKRGWLHALKEKCAAPYPEALRQAVIAKNWPVLRQVIPSYLHQIEKAIKRNDLVSVNHRVAALLASYFDVLFALNRLPNPGEKQLLAKAAAQCEKTPPAMAAQVESVLRAASTPTQDLVAEINALIDGLEQLLAEEGFVL